MTVHQVEEQNFEQEVVKSSVPVLVDFWAEWCGPCRMLAPILEEVATDLGETAKVVKINIDNAPGIAAGYGVKGIPALMLFKNGEIVTNKTGVSPAGAITKWVNQNI